MNHRELLPTSSADFRDKVLAVAIQSLKFNTFTDNFDTAVFNADGVDRSKIFQIGERVAYFKWLLEHQENLFAAYSLLSNDESRALYFALICYRLAGHHSFRIPTEYSTRLDALPAYRALEAGTESRLPVNGMFGTLKHLDFVFEGKRYIADCIDLEALLFRRQYFYELDGIRIQPETGDHVVDGGACTGDSALVFSNAVGESGKVYAFDPVDDHLTIIRHNIDQFPLKNVALMPYGIGDRNAYHPPLVLNRYNPGFNANQGQVPLRSVDFLKLDVEGSEVAAIRGAVETIRRFKPKLAISLYHKPNDIFDLILLIRHLFPFYRRYAIGHYSIQMGESVLYVST